MRIPLGSLHHAHKKVEMTVELSTRQISEAGKLLVQYKLQLEGVDSERNALGSKPHLVAAGSSDRGLLKSRTQAGGRKGPSGARLDARWGVRG